MNYSQFFTTFAQNIQIMAEQIKFSVTILSIFKLYGILHQDYIFLSTRTPH